MNRRKAIIAALAAPFAAHGQLSFSKGTSGKDIVFDIIIGGKEYGPDDIFLKLTYGKRSVSLTIDEVFEALSPTVQGDLIVNSSGSGSIATWTTPEGLVEIR